MKCLVDQAIHVNSLVICLLTAAAAAAGGTAAAADDDYDYDYVGTVQWSLRRVTYRSVLRVLRLQKAVSPRHPHTVCHHSHNYMHCCKS